MSLHQAHAAMPMPPPPRMRGPTIDTPLKGKISRHFQSLGGCKTRGAATATALKFRLAVSNGAAKVKLFDSQVRDGTASRSGRRATGRPQCFDEAVGERIETAFAAEETMTYREAGEKNHIPKSTMHRYATKQLGYRCLGVKTRPMPSEANREKRVTMGKDIVSTRKIPTPCCALGSDYDMGPLFRTGTMEHYREPQRTPA